MTEEKEEGVGVEKENYDDNLEERAERDDVSEGLEEVPSVVAKAREDTVGLQVGEKVFGKIYGFPPWPAELVDTNPSNSRLCRWLSRKKCHHSYREEGGVKDVLTRV